MKKFLTIVVIIFALILGAWFTIEKVFRGGDAYYTQITSTGTYHESKTDSGEIIGDYSYDQPGYDANGHKIRLKFNGNKTRPLKRNAYIEVTYRNGDVRSWKQVAEKDIPKKALVQLKK